MKTIANIPIANTVYISVLAIILLIITNNINEYYDIIAADEISYLHYGKLVLKEIHTEWGFCYSLWYKLLSFFSYSTIDLYYLNYRVLMVLIPILLFILLVRYQVELPIAFALSFLFGISKLHITTWPFVSDFCILVFLIYLCIITYIKENTTKSKILLFISAILYLTRPEFIILYIASIGLALYYNRKFKKNILFIILFSILILFLGFSAKKIMGIDRSFFAYVQHYFLTYKIWNKTENISIYQYFELIPKLFGKSFTLFESIIYNPLAFLQHIVTCVGFYLISFLKTLEEYLLPSFWFKPIGKFKHLLFIGYIIGIIFYYKKTKTKFRFSAHKFLLFSIGLFFVSAMVSNFIIGYNPHYLQLHFIVILLLGSIVLLSKKQLLNLKETNHYILTLSLCLLAFFIKPTLKEYSFQEVDYNESKNLPVQKMIKYLDLNDNGKKHVLLAYQTNLHFALKNNKYEGFDVFSINQPFIQFIQKNKVDVIYINSQLTSDIKLQKDIEWKHFISNPQKYGFKKFNLKGTKNYLLMKQ
ncbi:MAG TPA: hypothetical protein PK301_06440 [Chitinophagales bacterium]|nr:hypothetical protein [Chitinophagales bacterium]